MSSGSEDDDGMCTFVVVRTTDAKKQELTLPLSTKLGELKQTLLKEEYFGPMPPEGGTQRIFHLGREWKSHGRTLSKLGLGRFNNKILHLQMITNNDNNKKQEEKSAVATKPKARKRTSTRQQQQRTSSSSSAAAASEAAEAEAPPKPVIELLDDDSDDDVVEISQPQRRSRNSKRRRVS